MQELRLLWYWTQWISKTHIVTLHHIITVYNHIFNQSDKVLQDSTKKSTQWTEDLFFAVRFTQWKVFKYHDEVTPMMVMLLITTHILNCCRMLPLSRMQLKGKDINPEKLMLLTTQCHDVFLKYVENKYCAKQRHLHVMNYRSVPSNNLFPISIVSGSGKLLLIHIICLAMMQKA